MTCAVRLKKPIFVLGNVKHSNYEPLSNSWKPFKSILFGPKTIMYNPIYASRCATNLIEYRKNPEQHAARMYTPNSGDNLL